MNSAQEAFEIFEIECLNMGKGVYLLLLICQNYIIVKVVFFKNEIIKLL